MQNQVNGFFKANNRDVYNQTCVCIQRLVAEETAFPRVWRKDVTTIGTFLFLLRSNRFPR